MVLLKKKEQLHELS